VEIYIVKTLPFLTTSILPEEIEFNFIFDENSDVSIFANMMRNISDTQFRTDLGKPFKLLVSDVMKGYGFEMPRDVYEDNEVFVLGDTNGVGGFLSRNNVG